MTQLTADEREVIVTLNDAEKVWRVYSDSLTMRGAVLRLARQLGVEIQRVEAHGIEFTCQGDALRLTAKRRRALSAEQREAARERGRHLPRRAPRIATLPPKV